MHEKNQAHTRVGELETRLHKACQALRTAEDEVVALKLELDQAESRNAELLSTAAIPRTISEVATTQLQQCPSVVTAMSTTHARHAVSSNEEGTTHEEGAMVVVPDRQNGEVSPSTVLFCREQMEARLEGLRAAVEEEELEAGAQVREKQRG